MDWPCSPAWIAHFVLAIAEGSKKKNQLFDFCETAFNARSIFVPTAAMDKELTSIGFRRPIIRGFGSPSMGV